MEFVLFDDHTRENFLPLAHTKAIAMLRCGIVTMQDKWEHYLQGKGHIITADYLMPVYNPTNQQANLYINSRFFPTETLVSQIAKLEDSTALFFENELVAFHYNGTLDIYNLSTIAQQLKPIPVTGDIDYIAHIWDIFMKNESQILADFEWVTRQAPSQVLPADVTAIAPENIYIAPDAIVNPCIINATNAKIYIGPRAEIMEGSILRGTISIGAHAVLKMGAKVYGGTTIGPGCKVGGEVQNVVFYGNSNKGHDGYLGNAIIGEWCNIGADTNCSNLKNDYSNISIYDEATHKKVNTGLQFCGLIMGDHSKTAINTMFNTGTVIGMGCSIFGSTFPPVFIPSFSWGGSDKMISYVLSKCIEACNRMMERRGKQLSPAEESVFQYVYERTMLYKKKL